MSQNDYDKYTNILNNAKEVLDKQSISHIETYMQVKNMAKALKTIDGDVISGVASVSIYPVPQNMTAHSFNGFKFEGAVDIVVHGKQDPAKWKNLHRISPGNRRGNRN